MLRSHTCGELRTNHIDQQVSLCGWSHKVRDKGGVVWIDLRDRYGVTQLIFEEGITPPDLIEKAKEIGREFVLKATGKVVERYNKNDVIPTGHIEVRVDDLIILNKSKTPPFTIEEQTDGGEELRMKYRYLDIRRDSIREKLELRNKMMQKVREYLNGQHFVEVETPYLIKSTPEGARDFVVPSRMNQRQFYALPQSPQTFKQLLMVAGMDRYFQIVKCFRDEDLRADRQPEFTQIDCEMSFVDQEDVLQMFEGMTKFLYKEIKGITLDNFQRLTFAEAMQKYGSDKPDLRFGMEFCELATLVKNSGFQVFDTAELVVGINAEGCAYYSRKQLDALTDFVRKPQIGAKGLVYVKYNEDGSIKSSVDKFFDAEQLKQWATRFKAKPGDLLLILAGEEAGTRNALNELRLEMGDRLGLRNPDQVSAAWIVDFPLLEWDEETKRYHAMHHPFTSPKHEDVSLLETKPSEARANAYDLVINGVEAGGGSIRIHDRKLQEKMFEVLGFSEEEAESQFGFLMGAFEYGAPPHGGVAFGFDRLCAIMAGEQSIRDFIAFPKNNAGKDVMINSPSEISQEQLVELGITTLQVQEN
ncbi:MAG: aspartate--tRNA ligase [Bacteroidota bacterium]